MARATMAATRGVQFFDPRRTRHPRARYPTGGLQRFTRVEGIELVLGRLTRAVKESWQGSAFRLVPAHPWKRWFPELRPFDTVLCHPKGASSFASRAHGQIAIVPNDERASWMVTRLKNSA